MPQDVLPKYLKNVSQALLDRKMLSLILVVDFELG